MSTVKTEIVKKGDTVEAPKKPSTAPKKPSNIENGNKEKTFEQALDNAAALGALKASISADAIRAEKDADKRYIIDKKRHMLNRCKSDTPIRFIGEEIYAPMFGKVYTFLLNTIPVTVRFDNSEQVLPEFVYNHLRKKMLATAKNNKPTIVNEVIHVDE